MQKINLYLLMGTKPKQNTGMLGEADEVSDPQRRRDELEVVVGTRPGPFSEPFLTSGIMLLFYHSV